MYKLAHRILKNLNPELAHNLSIKALKMGLYPNIRIQNTEILEQTIWGRRFQTPIGLSAGFDKNAEVIKPILNLGFSFTELGTVTPMPQLGNPKPRIHRFDAKKALVNSLGFNNTGMEVFEKNIIDSNIKENFQDKIIGINIGNNKDTIEIIKDLEIVFNQLHRLGDYIVINLSSPNTPGLRENLKSNHFEKIVNQIHRLRDDNHSRIPILFKISPDITDQEKKDIALISLANDIDGLIISNTSTTRPSSLTSRFLDEKGGLSGKPLRDKSNDVLRLIASKTRGEISLIGVGGISNAKDVYQKIKLGASAVQLYTALTFEGSKLIENIKRDLVKFLKQDNFENIEQAVRSEIKN